MPPEDQARRNIDYQLDACGWILQDFSSMNIMAGLGVAVREYQLTTGEADYGLYIDAVGLGRLDMNKSKPTAHLSGKALAAGLLRWGYRRLAPRRSHNPQLREILLRPEHQVIDKFTRDGLLTSSFDPEAKNEPKRIQARSASE